MASAKTKKDFPRPLCIVYFYIFVIRFNNGRNYDRI